MAAGPVAKQGQARRRRRRKEEVAPPAARRSAARCIKQSAPEIFGHFECCQYSNSTFAGPTRARAAHRRRKIISHYFQGLLFAFAARATNERRSAPRRARLAGPGKLAEATSPRPGGSAKMKLSESEAAGRPAGRSRRPVRKLRPRNPWSAHAPSSFPRGAPIDRISAARDRAIRRRRQKARAMPPSPGVQTHTWSHAHRATD